MVSQRHIELQVDWHPSGNFTLKERNIGDLLWTDVSGKDFFCNSDEGSFYRAVARRLTDYASKGIFVENYKQARAGE